MVACALLCANVARAQSRSITGRIVSEDGGPLAQASVTIAGTTIGTHSGDDGRFVLRSPSPSAVLLRVRRIGYTPRSVPVAATEADISIALTKDVLQLDALVVTGTATTVSSQNAANAVSVVSGEQLTKVASATIDHALAGKVAGAVISQNSGAPGGGTQVQLRGTSTILGGYSPLYVIDGVIANNSAIAGGLNVISGAGGGNLSSAQDQSVNRIADLNPNDVEDIQVLKGASAASIYGSKGTNGVIIITTKQGRAGRNNIDLIQRVGRSSLSHSLGSRCFASAAEYGDWAANILGDSKTAAAAEWTAAPIKCHDYENEFYSNQQLAYETIGSVRGGNSSGTSFFLSGLAKHDNGLAPNDFYSKQALRLNLGQNLGSRLSLHANGEMLHSLTQRGISGNDNNGISPGAIFSSTPSFIELRRQVDGTFPINSSGLLAGSNPFQNADIIKTPENVYRFIASGSANLSIFSSDRQTLDATLTGGVDSYADKSRVISPASGYTEQASFGSNAGTLFNSDAAVLNANLNGSLVHRLALASTSATTSAGFRQEHRESSVTQITGRGVIFPTVLNVAGASQSYPLQQQALVADLAFFAQEELSTLGERLLLTAAVNAERSSNNGDQEKYYLFPKASASYRMTTLPSFVNEFKARVAYGKAGNQPPNPAPLTPGRSIFLTTLQYEGITGVRASTLKGSTTIRPETATETEGGFDATLWNSRVRLGATHYRKQVDNLLLATAVATSTGFVTQYVNGGQIVSHGTELQLEASPVQTAKVTWISGTTFAKTKGKVTQLPVPGFNPGVGSFSTSFGNAWIEEGQSPTVIQSYVGCRQLNASGVCPAANRILGFAGDGTPDYTMGFTNEISVGHVRLSGLVEWRKGGDVVNLTDNYFDAVNLAKDTLTSQQRYVSWRAGNPVYVQNGGFVKLRELTVAYELPSAMTRTLFNGLVQSARFDVSGRNLKTWTKYDGYDPEVSNFGNQALGRFQDVTPYPPSRQILVSISTTF